MTDLIDDDMPGAFSLHPDLPWLTVAQLESYHQRYLERRDRATALVLARLAAIASPRWRSRAFVKTKVVLSQSTRGQRL
jgi:hypothetical protein